MAPYTYNTGGRDKTGIRGLCGPPAETQSQKRKRHFCISYFSACCDKILTRSHSREARFIVASVRSCALLWQEHAVTGHVVPTSRKQREKDAC